MLDFLSAGLGYLKRKSILLFLFCANRSITSFIPGILLIEIFSTEIMASAFSLSCFIVLLKKVLTLFRVEKQRSGSALVIGIVKRIFISLVNSLSMIIKIEHKPSLINNILKSSLAN